MDPQLILVNWQSEAVNLTEIFSGHRFQFHFADNPSEAAKAVRPATFLALWDARGHIAETLEALSLWESDANLARPPILMVVRADEVSEILSERPELDLAFMHPAQLSARVSQYLALYDQRIELRTLQKSEARLRQDLALDQQNRETATRLMNENQRALSKIFEPMESRGEAILLTNTNAVTYYTNSAFQTLTGLGSKAAFGTPAFEVLDIDSPPLPFDNILTIARESGPWRGEVTLGTHGRPQRMVHLEVDAVHGSNDEFEGYFFIIRDVDLLRNLMGDLQELAQLDLLTQLYNRVFFVERLKAECGRSKRYGHPMVLLVLDIDRFRMINETHGHIAGDAILAQIGTLVREFIRTTDFAARYDGDHFSIALPDTNLDGGLAFASRLADTLKHKEFLIHGDISVGISCSIGLAPFEQDCETIHEFLDAAEEALEQAQIQGGGGIEPKP